MKKSAAAAPSSAVLLLELEENIAHQDLVKAEVVLAHLGEMDENLRQQVVAKLAAAEPEWTLRLLVKHFRKVPEDRTHFEEYGDLVWHFMEHHPLLLEKHINETFRPFLVEALGRQGRPSLILHALEMCEWIHDEDIVPLVADYLHSGQRSFVLQSIRSLGAMGNDLAIAALGDRMGSDREVDHATVDALALHPQPAGLELLIQTIKSPEASLRNHAKNALTRLGKAAVPALCQALTDPDKDLQIHLLNVLGLIEDPHAVEPIRELLLRGAEDACVRFAAYEALGSIPLKSKSYALAVGLTDEDEQVRFAAARAINRNMTPALERGLFHMIHGRQGEVMNLIEVFLNSESDRIFLTLIADNEFKRQACLFLQERAHPALRVHYAELLRRYGETAMADLILPKETSHPAASEIWAVDDSRMVLKIYRKTLHNLGREVELFEFPSRALEKIVLEKPRLIFVDLNMPEMNGLDFCRQVRQKYDRQQLPIVLVTTQTESQDQREIQESGISLVLAKPFSEEALQKAMQDLLGGR
jgi:CheY-like chemotaxis protein